MAIILNIDTSSKYCSIAVAQDGEVIFGLESSKEMDHSVSLAPFVEKAIEFIKQHKYELDAVSVTIGPGSYTGLRIGLSMAKGLTFGLSLPLITLSALEVIAVRSLFSDSQIDGDEIIVAMMDAGRMEVYSGVYDLRLNHLQEEAPEILNEKSYIDLQKKRKVIFAGDGVKKFETVYSGKNGTWKCTAMPHAKYMASLSELKFRKKEFTDIAYSAPRYLKNYNAVKSKSKL